MDTGDKSLKDIPLKDIPLVQYQETKRTKKNIGLLHLLSLFCGE